VNVSNSNTPKSERLTDMCPEIQWIDIDWKKVTQSINRLQTRITKAVLSTAARYIKGYERLEPDVVKVASPVLRRGRASNRSFLFCEAAKVGAVCRDATRRDNKDERILGI